MIQNWTYILTLYCFVVCIFGMRYWCLYKFRCQSKCLRKSNYFRLVAQKSFDDSSTIIFALRCVSKHQFHSPLPENLWTDKETEGMRYRYITHIGSNGFGLGSPFSNCRVWWACTTSSSSHHVSIHLSIRVSRRFNKYDFFFLLFLFFFSGFFFLLVTATVIVFISMVGVARRSVAIA